MVKLRKNSSCGSREKVKKVKCVYINGPTNGHKNGRRTICGRING